MSFFGSLAKKVGHVIAAPAKGLLHAVEDPGKWASNLGHQATDPKTLIGLASALALPGVGGALTGALGAIPGIGGALASGAGAVGGGVGAAASKIPGVTSLKSVLGMDGEAVGGAIPDAAMGSGGGFSLSGLLGDAGHFLTANGGKNALGVAQGINSILDQKKSENYGKDALGAAKEAYAQGAPLRAQGLNGLLNTQSPDLSTLQALQNHRGFTPPTPTGITQFTAPQRPTRAPQSPGQQVGNPYAQQQG